jgi:hypothetical protein
MEILLDGEVYGIWGDEQVYGHDHATGMVLVVGGHAEEAAEEVQKADGRVPGGEGDEAESAF